MVSIEITEGAVDRVRALVPTGTESYLVTRSGAAFLNIRTADRGLLDRLRAAAR